MKYTQQLIYKKKIIISTVCLNSLCVISNDKGE